MNDGLRMSLFIIDKIIQSVSVDINNKEIVNGIPIYVALDSINCLNNLVSLKQFPKDGNKMVEIISIEPVWILIK